jgi:formamidopyrimidine-DNA glycosylase
MIEISEAKVIVEQINTHLKGLTIIGVDINHYPHKFAWFSFDSKTYENKLIHQTIIGATQSGNFIRIHVGNENELALSEDLVFSYVSEKDASDKHQIKLYTDHGTVLEVKTKLYAFMLCGTMNELKEKSVYYKRALSVIDPLSNAFTFDYFKKETEMDQAKGSLKDGLATKQHIPGLGNGTLLEILFDAKLSPKKKMNSLTPDEQFRLYQSTQKIISKIKEAQGRNQSLDLFGQPGHYEVLMSSKKDNCPSCNETLVKENYLGGKIIYCPNCQKG